MRRAAMFAVPLVLVSVATAAGAAPQPSKRTVTEPYKTGANVAGTLTGYFDFNGDVYGGADFAVKKDDRSFVVTLKDDTGRPVLGELGFDTTGDGRSDGDLGMFCGTSPSLKVPGPGTLVVWVSSGPCGSDVSAPTKGTATVEFTRARSR